MIRLAVRKWPPWQVAGPVLRRAMSSRTNASCKVSGLRSAAPGCLRFPGQPRTITGGTAVRGRDCSIRLSCQPMSTLSIELNSVRHFRGGGMGAWGTGLYSGDFAADLRAAIAAVARLPLDEERLVDAICEAERSAATNPADEDHTIFWLVPADQFEKRGIFSRRVRDMALAIINDRRDAAAMQALGMKPADTRKRAGKLAELRARLLAQPEFSRPRKTITEPEPYVFQLFGVYAYPTSAGKPLNPY